jgi:hypothetical protein
MVSVKNLGRQTIIKTTNYLGGGYIKVTEVDQTGHNFYWEIGVGLMTTVGGASTKKDATAQAENALIDARNFQLGFR